MITHDQGTPQRDASSAGHRARTGGPPAPLDETMASDLAALGRRLAPRWWFFLPEALLLGLALGLMRVNAGWAGITAGVMCVVLLALQRTLYRRVRAARIDRTIAATALSGWWMAGMLVVIGGLAFFGAFLLDRVLTSWIATAGVMLALAAGIYVMTHGIERSTVRGLLDGTAPAELMKTVHPLVEPAFADEPETLRLAVVLSCVEAIRRDALRHDLNLPRARFDELVAELERHALVAEERKDREKPGTDGDAAWLRLSFRGQTALRQHLAATAAPTHDGS